jgi:DNA-binding CsgD family transcriptional regulator
MKKNHQHPGTTGNKNRIERAEDRAEQAETRTEQAKTRTELAEIRTEQAETRTEFAKTRTEQAEIRTEQAETRVEQVESTLRLLVQGEINPGANPPRKVLASIPAKAIACQLSPLEQLTSRQREILKLIAKGENTKRIAEILKLSPKTVEYHRMKLMNSLNIHDVPGLVRFALRVKLISQES